jgi:DNA-binding GntR family transcriptional regulator
MQRTSENAMPKTLSESVYNNLKTMIINNEYKAGQRIYEKEVAKLYGVSTTPVREAFLRLSAEGYVSIDSHRKALVRKASFKELEEIFEVLGDLDGLAIAQAADHISPECIQQIEELIAEMEETCKPTFVEKFLDLNVAVHSQIWSSLPNKMLERTLHFVHGQLLRYNYARYLAFQDPEIMKQSLNGHKEILSALSKKNKKELKKLIKTHWSFLTQHLHLRNKFLSAFKGGETTAES